MAKKFTFSLEKLLRYREQVLEVERGVLADMNARLHALLQTLEQLRQRLHSGAQELNQKYAQGTTPPEIMRHKIYLDSLREEIRQQEIKIELQRQAIDRQTEKVREAKIEISTIEKLREKKLEEYNYLENKAQELFIEEFVSNQRAMAMEP